MTIQLYETCGGKCGIAQGDYRPRLGVQVLTLWALDCSLIHVSEFVWSQMVLAVVGQNQWCFNGHQFVEWCDHSDCWGATCPFCCWWC